MTDSSMLNVAFEVPSWVKQGVEAGTYKIFGGVVRDSMGQIIVHLKEASLQNTKKSNKNSLIIVVGIGVALVVVGGYYFIYRKYKSMKNQELSQQLNNIGNDIKKYFNKGNFAILTRNDIESLIRALKTVLENPDFDHIKMDKQLYSRIVEFSKCINRNTYNLALFRKEQIHLQDPQKGDSFNNIIDTIIRSLAKQKELIIQED